MKLTLCVHCSVLCFRDAELLRRHIIAVAWHYRLTGVEFSFFLPPSVSPLFPYVEPLTLQLGVWEALLGPPVGSGRSPAGAGLSRQMILVNTGVTKCSSIGSSFSFFFENKCVQGTERTVGFFTANGEKTPDIRPL